MALTRKFLKAMGVDEEKIEQIIEEHTTTVDALKTELNSYKDDAAKLPKIQKELDDLKAANDGEDTYKVKYDAIKEEFEQYKTDVTAKENKAKLTAAYKQVLVDAGVSAKRIDSVLRVSKLDDIEIDDAGNIKNIENVREAIKTEWADFIEVSAQKGADTKNPPNNVGGKALTIEDFKGKSADFINAHWDEYKASLKK